MKGLELARAYYEAYGKPMLEKDFADVRQRIAVGLCGHGSECFGWDDEVSRDHDFEPGFCLWLTEADERAFGFRLFRAYSKLPREFDGVRMENKSLFGSDFKGVHTIGQFYGFYIGDHVPETNEEWLAIPDLLSGWRPPMARCLLTSLGIYPHPPELLDRRRMCVKKLGP